MPLSHDFALLLAQATPTPTPQALNVTLVDEGKEWWRDYVVPAATLTAALVGGVGGVVIGGLMNRKTMRAVETERAEREDARDTVQLDREGARDKKQADREDARDAAQAKRDEERAAAQAAREDARDAAQAERDDARAAAQAERELSAQRRLALGSARLLKEELARGVTNLNWESERPGDDPLLPKGVDIEVRVRPEDKHAIAMWVSDPAWGLISSILDGIETFNLRRVATQEVFDAGGSIDADGHRKAAASLGQEINRTLELLDRDFRRLQAD